MELILQEDVPSLGRAGELVKVRDGYGRNYLLPQKLAVLADPKNIKEMDHHKRVIARKQSKLVQKASDVKVKLDQHVLTIAKEAGEEDKLFGSVTNHEIADLLKEAGFLVDKRMVHLQEPIKAIGEYSVPVRLMADVSATIKVTVVKKNA
ncbi:MAG: 50S ribosomal protein L9 [Deltaproteobacteria bacterium]|nr:50S ribosomal protein L9 [Deltaproteobacteria bacterium]